MKLTLDQLAQAGFNPVSEEKGTYVVYKRGRYQIIYDNENGCIFHAFKKTLIGSKVIHPKEIYTRFVK